MYVRLLYMPECTRMCYIGTERRTTKAKTKSTKKHLAACCVCGTNNPPANPPTFGLTPGLATRGIIDYTTKAGATLYRSATQKVSEELYDCTPEGFYQFIQKIKTRAEEFGWTETGRILYCPIDDTPGAEKVNLLD